MDIFWTSDLNQQSFDQAVLASKSDDQKWLYEEVFKSAEIPVRISRKKILQSIKWIP